MLKKPLTAAAVTRFKAPTKKGARVEKFDGLLPGFGVRITDTGAKSWIVLSQRGGGKRKRYTIGPVGLYTLEEARQDAREILRDIGSGLDPVAERRERKAKAQTSTFELVADRFIAEHIAKKSRGIETAAIINNRLMKPWGRRAISSITDQDVLDVVHGVLNEGYPRAANRLLGVVRTLFNWAEEPGHKYVTNNPAGGIKSPTEEKTRDRVLSDGEVRTLWRAWDATSYPFGLMLKMLLVTAQRRGEVAGMRWADIDFETGVWTLPREFTKSDRSHEVPLSQLALDILETLPRFVGPYVFTSTSGQRPVSGFSRMKRRFDALSGVEKWRLHDLRRTAGTNMAKLGIPVFVISRVLNHAEGGVTSIYARASYLKEKRHALETWATKLESLVSPTAQDKTVEQHA